MKNILKSDYTIDTFEHMSSPFPSQSESVCGYFEIIHEYASDHFLHYSLTFLKNVRVSFSHR